MRLTISLLAVLALPATAGCAGRTLDVGTLPPRPEGASAAATAGGAPGTPPIAKNSLHVIVGAGDYEGSCESAEGSVGSGWVGAGLDAQSEFGCPGWPKDRPRISLWVDLTGFLGSAGFQPGTYDIADPSIRDIAVTAQVESQAERPIGSKPAYANYSSSTGNIYATGNAVHAPGASGKVTVTSFVDDYERTNSSFDVTLTDVVLPLVDQVGQPDGASYPTTVTIRSARMTRQPH